MIKIDLLLFFLLIQDNSSINTERNERIWTNYEQVKTKFVSFVFINWKIQFYWTNYKRNERMPSLYVFKKNDRRACNCWHRPLVNQTKYFITPVFFKHQSIYLLHNLLTFFKVWLTILVRATVVQGLVRTSHFFS